MARIKVGVLRGGPSSEYDVSLQTGGAVLSNLGEQYEPHDFYIDKSGTWHHRGKPVEPIKAVRQVDVVFNALHGEYGEDGEVQRFLESAGVPYTGSGPLAAALAMNKIRSKEIATNLGFKTARHRLIDTGRDTEEQAKEIYYTLFQPLIVKPVSLGSSVGVKFAQGLDPLIDAIDELRKTGKPIMVEEYKKGVEASAGIVDEFRGRKRYTLFPAEIRPANNAPIFDYACKYGGGSEEICPGNFSREQSTELQRMAEAMHEALNLRHYSRSDFIVTPKRIFYLETNTLPGLTKESIMPKSLLAAGATLPEFLQHVIDMATHSVA